MSDTNSAWSLLEIKDGVQLSCHELQSGNAPERISLGRSPDADIVLQHESCSRQHAIIRASSSDQLLTITDCSSTHGTRVNQKPVPPNVAVTLKTGDILQFGASTRLYFVQGGNSSNSSNLADDDPVISYQILPESLQKQQSNNVDETDNNYRDDEGKPLDRTLDEFWMDESKLPETCRKEWDRYKAIKYKLDNIVLESDRIQSKGNDLNAGQEKQLQRNSQLLEKLKLSMEEKEGQLLQKLYPDQQQGSVHNRAGHGDDFEDEQVDDRTRDHDNDNDRMKPAETEESLLQKFKYHFALIQTLDGFVLAAEQTLAQLKQRVERLASDDEEVFFAQNNVDLASDTLDKRKKELLTENNAQQDVIKLLRVVNPKLVIDPLLGTVGTGPSATKVASPDRIHSPTICVLPTNAHDSAFAMPPPARMQQHSDTPVNTQCNGVDDNATILPPPRKRNRTMLPTENATASNKVASAGPLKRKPAVTSAQPRGTLAVFGTALKVSKGVVDKKAPAVSDLKADTWKIPKDQDGSGRTKLNEKFAGRY
jgi:pSer/pThr/pTyr-binding forkhead associated (FHA) protein